MAVFLWLVALLEEMEGQAGAQLLEQQALSPLWGLRGEVVLRNRHQSYLSPHLLAEMHMDCSAATISRFASRSSL